MSTGHARRSPRSHSFGRTLKNLKLSKNSVFCITKMLFNRDADKKKEAVDKSI